MKENREKFENADEYENNLNVNNKKFYRLLHGIYSLGAITFLIFAVLGYLLGIGTINLHMFLLIILFAFIMALFYNILDYYGYGHPVSAIVDAISFIYEFLIDSFGFLTIFCFVGIFVHILIP